MKRLLLCLFLAGCGGGGPSYTTPSAPNPPGSACCASTPVIAAYFADLYDEKIQTFTEQRQADEASYSASGQFSSGAHLQAFRNNCLNTSNGWTTAAGDFVQPNQPINKADIEDAVESYRSDLLAHFNAALDDLATRGNFSSGAVTQTRTEITNGVNAHFDALVAEVRAY